MTLADGKPDGCGAGCRGESGIEGTRQAPFEAEREGIHPFCVTIDRAGAGDLPRMYGHVNHAAIDAVHGLPVEVARICRHLST